MLLQAAGSANWLMYGHNYWNNRFSPLKLINTTNVRRLVARAVYTHGSTTLGSFETTPIVRSEEHTSELQSQSNLVCRLLLEKKKKQSILCLASGSQTPARSRRQPMPHIT